MHLHIHLVTGLEMRQLQQGRIEDDTLRVTHFGDRLYDAVILCFTALRVKRAGRLGQPWSQGRGPGRNPYISRTEPRVRGPGLQELVGRFCRPCALTRRGGAHSIADVCGHSNELGLAQLGHELYADHLVWRHDLANECRHDTAHSSQVRIAVGASEKKIALGQNVFGVICDRPTEVTYVVELY